MTADPELAAKFRRLLTGEEKGYAEHAWDELARVAAEHYEVPRGTPMEQSHVREHNNGFCVRCLAEQARPDANGPYGTSTTEEA